MESYEEPLTQFLDGVPNPTTRDHYQRFLGYFFKFLELEGDSLEINAKILAKRAKEDQDWASAYITKFIRFQKERAEKREISVSSIANYYKPIKAFCEMNDITINWEKIKRTIPKNKRRSTDRIPTIDEIKQLLNYPDRRLKAAILVMMSSGIRLGAWEYLRWGDITPIIKDDKVIAAKMIVYRGDQAEYTTFITPEAYQALKEYIDFRIAHREIVNEKSWVMRDEFDVSKYSKGFATIPKRLEISGLKRLIERALWAEGVRQPLEKGQKRHEFKADHGFRKYFKTMAEQQMKSLHVEILMGHSTGLADNYYRISEDDLLSEYLKAVPVLSVYQSPLAISDDTIKNIQQEVSKIKYEFDGLKKFVINNTQITSGSIDRFLGMNNRLRLKKQHLDNDNVEEARRIFYEKIEP